MSSRLLIYICCPMPNHLTRDEDRESPSPSSLDELKRRSMSIGNEVVDQSSYCGWISVWKDLAVADTSNPHHLLFCSNIVDEFDITFIQNWLDYSHPLLGTRP